MPDRLQIKHFRTADLNKVPSASTLAYGEIAVNYNAESPNLYIKDSDDNVVGFVSESYFEKIVGTGITENGTTAFTPISEVIQQDEMTVSAALNDLNDRKADKTYVDEAISASTIEVDSQLDSASTNPVENRVIYQVIVDDEEAISSALNDLNSRKADKSYVDSAVSSITIDVDSTLDSASTNPVENRVIYQVIADDEEVISAALNDLNDRKADKTYVDSAISASTLDIDDDLDSGSTNPVANSAITSAINELRVDLDEMDEVTSAAFNDLNDRKADKAYVDSAVSSITFDVDSQLDSASTNPVENRVIYNELQSMLIEVDDHLDSASTNPVENRAIWEFLRDDERVIAEALNDLNDRVDELSGETSDYALKTDITITAVTVNGSASTVSNKVAGLDLSLLPDVSSSDNGKVLKVVNGDWEPSSGITVYVGEAGNPPASLGGEGDVYLQATPIEYVKKPVTVYETDGTTGLLGINSDMDTTTWQLQNLDLSGFTYVTAYIKQADVPLTGTDHLYATPALMVNIPLDDASKSSRYDAYVGAAAGTNMQDRDVHFTVLCAVDSTKTKFKVLTENSIAGTLLGDRNTNGRYCYKIVGHYD